MSAAIQHIFVETNQIRLHVVTAGDPGGKPVIYCMVFQSIGTAGGTKFQHWQMPDSE